MSWIVGQGRTNARDSRCNRVAVSFCSKVISTSGLVSDILSSGCRSMWRNVDSAISKSGMVENVGVAIEISFVVAIHAQVSCIYAGYKV